MIGRSVFFGRPCLGTGQYLRPYIRLFFLSHTLSGGGGGGASLLHALLTVGGAAVGWGWPNSILISDQPFERNLIGHVLDVDLSENIWTLDGREAFIRFVPVKPIQPKRNKS